jgi:hypothetical protein
MTSMPPVLMMLSSVSRVGLAEGRALGRRDALQRLVEGRLLRRQVAVDADSERRRIDQAREPL